MTKPKKPKKTVERKAFVFDKKLRDSAKRVREILAEERGEKPKKLVGITIDSSNAMDFFKSAVNLSKNQSPIGVLVTKRDFKRLGGAINRKVKKNGIMGKLFGFEITEI